MASAYRGGLGLDLRLALADLSLKPGDLALSRLQRIKILYHGFYGPGGSIQVSSHE